jgi:glyoxylase-like metal-dependent hydrolase (beta-lactamase superfamily II)
MAESARPVVEPVATKVHVPEGMLGSDQVTFDVRCFIVRGGDGLLLVDAGPHGTTDLVEGALRRLGADWPDVLDIVLTHGHIDHVGGLATCAAKAPKARVWAGAREVRRIDAGDDRPIGSLVDGDRVGELLVLDTPGHTPGHISLLHEAGSLVFVGDVAGSTDGKVSPGPRAFTDDPVQARESLLRVASLGVERVLFSHGPEVDDPNAGLRRLLDRPAAR